MLRTLVVTQFEQQPHRTVRWTRAMGMVLCKKCGRFGCDRHPEFVRATVLRTYEAEIASADACIEIPAVIELRRHVPYTQRAVRYNRINVLLRDKFRCAYDGQKYPVHMLTLDHVKPRSKWTGPIEKLTTWENTVSACKPCNLRKGPRTPEEAGMKLHFQPHKPDRLPPMPFMLPRDVPVEWKDWVGHLQREVAA